MQQERQVSSVKQFQIIYGAPLPLSGWERTPAPKWGPHILSFKDSLLGVGE